MAVDRFPTPAHQTGRAELPHDLPPWHRGKLFTIVSGSWRRNGTWQKIHDSIRESVREAAGRHPEPTGAIVDSQSVQTTEQGGAEALMPRRTCLGASATCWSTSRRGSR